MQTVVTSATAKTMREQYIETRKRVGTQAEVAKMLKIATSALCRRESGKRPVKDEAMRAMQHLASEHGTNERAHAREARPVTVTSKPSTIAEGMTEEEMQSKYAAFVAETRLPAWRNTQLLGSIDGKTYYVDAENTAHLSLKTHASFLAETFAKYFPGAAFSVSEAKN